jgi:hypothetical protein
LLLDAFAPDLPDWLIARKKQPFTVPITAWLTGDLRSYARTHSWRRMLGCAIS